MTEAKRYLMYIRQITADWNKLVGECGRLEQENRALKEKLLTTAAKGGIIEKEARLIISSLITEKWRGVILKAGVKEKWTLINQRKTV